MEIKIDENKNLRYRIQFDDEEIVKWSTLGLTAGDMVVGKSCTIETNKTASIHTKFDWPLGEDDVIECHYNEMVLNCKSGLFKYDFIVRLFDGSVAFRYHVYKRPDGHPWNLTEENTSFQMASPYTIYQYNQESIFKPLLIDSLSNTCDLPATLTNGKYFVSVGEASNDNYTKAELKLGDTNNELVLVFPKDKQVGFGDRFQTPWRTVSIATSAIGLHKFSQLYLKLVTPSQRSVPTWIKPGKLIRAQLNTQSGLDCIDFAAAHNFQYIMFDAGWYGAEFRSTSNPTQVIPEINMDSVIRHGKEKGIGVILYVNYVGLKSYLDTILPLYKNWGVAGIKFGFVDGLTQGGLTWLADAIKKTTDQGFILDIHDNYKPTGLSRAYPALLTQEGIRGDENSPDAFHTTVLPFTRFLSGPADFTFCYPNSKNSFSKNLKVSKAHQLALTVVNFSPLQSMFWYGKPKDYTDEDDIEFFKWVPTVWNESHYLAGEIGKGISVVRRSQDTWFMGSIAGLEGWQKNVSLDFLPPGKKYTATIYEDAEGGSVRKRSIPVDATSIIKLDIKPSQGQAIILRKN